MTNNEPSLILTNGLILADPDRPEVEPHNRTIIAGDTLVQVNDANVSPFPSANVLDCSGCLIIPGLVNAHTHAAMSLLRGLADDVPLDKWLNDYVFPVEGKHADPDFVYLGTKLSAVEMALAGITTFADGYFHMESSARAVSEVGLRGVIAQGILDVPAPDAPEPGSWTKRVECFLKDFPAHPLVTPALFCHSPYLCGPETLKQANDLAKMNNIPLFVHVSETQWEVEEITRRHGLRPVEHLGRLGILGKDLIAVHAIHLSAAEIDLLAKTGAKVVHCPESNMKLASGAAPVRDFIARGVTLGIGTDGPASNNNLDLFEEMRSASLLAKLVCGDPLAVDARTVLRMATLDGARTLGMQDHIGCLVPEKKADITVVAFDRIHLSPVYDPVSHLVYAARGSDVRHVVVNGKIVVREGRMVSVDEDELREQAQRKATEIGKELNMKIPLEVRRRDD